MNFIKTHTAGFVIGVFVTTTVVAGYVSFSVLRQAITLQNLVNQDHNVLAQDDANLQQIIKIIQSSQTQK